MDATPKLERATADFGGKQEERKTDEKKNKDCGPNQQSPNNYYYKFPLILPLFLLFLSEMLGLFPPKSRFQVFLYFFGT